MKLPRFAAFFLGMACSSASIFSRRPRGVANISTATLVDTSQDDGKQRVGRQMKAAGNAAGAGIPTKNAAGNAAGTGPPIENTCNVNGAIVPKVFIVSMFKPEGTIWYTNANSEGSIGNLLAKNFTVPGLSFTYPQVHCLADCSVCQFTTGESEINAATSMTALILSQLFDLRKTYFLIAGIAGMNPESGTIADVAFAKYSVQVALQYEFDARDKPETFNTGYVPQGSNSPDEYPQSIYGTEVFELNAALRDMAFNFASSAILADTSVAKEYRTRYSAPAPNKYEAATRDPSIRKCDVACSDVFYSGTRLGESMDATSRLWTNGSAVPCMTAQEDNATLEAMIRFAKVKLVDFSRIILMRSAANFDRPYPGLTAANNLFYSNQGGFLSSIANLYLCGTPIIKGILQNWSSRFGIGVEAPNYIGDILGTLGGVQDFGPSEFWRQRNPVTAFEKRGMDGIEELSRRYAYSIYNMKGQDTAEVMRANMQI